MSQIAMPLVVINLGGEMIYILEQRLKAQNIPPDKSCKVLNDVVKTMFDKQYVDKLFTPQELYSMASTRKIFDRLAHSSIMRLSESSMDKLFDLMVMGFKYQLQCSTKTETVLEVTKRHLSTTRALLSEMPTEPAVMELLSNVDDLVAKTYSNVTMGQLHLLRQTLQRFLQDKRVKVSLFLQEGIQASSGRLILPSPSSGFTAAVTYYDAAGSQASQDKVKLKCMEYDPVEFFIHPAALGSNLYNKERNKVVPPPRKGDLVTGPANDEDASPMAGKSAYAEDVLDQGGRGAHKELDLLQALLALKPAPPDNFKLNLFGDDEHGASGSGQGGMVLLTFGEGGKNDAYKQQGLAGVISTLNIDDKPGDTDDLLDLMDSAAT